MFDATNILVSIAILVMSVVIHEVSHGAMAYFLGDKTAYYEGRLTLNPIPHLDPFGSVLLPIMLVLFQSPIMFGYAKPVPYNPYNLRNQKWGPALVGAAGPFSNLSVALVFGILVRLINANVFTFLPDQFVSSFLGIAVTIIFINLLLAVFNLVPIPPLDGSKVLFAMLSYRWYRIQVMLEQYGFILLIVFILFLFPIVSFIVNFLFKLIVGFFIF